MTFWLGFWKAVVIPLVAAKAVFKEQLGWTGGDDELVIGLLLVGALIGGIMGLFAGITIGMEAK